MSIPFENSRPEFPFAAVAGLDLAKRALLLLAVDPGLKGVLMASGPGTAKTLLARSFRRLLSGDPYVEVPLGVTEERLLGSLCLERTLSTGRPVMQEGLLARAHRGVLYVDEINLLNQSLARHISSALKTGVVRLEREGLSAELRSAFTLIGTYDPAEGEVGASLLDRVGIRVVETGFLSSRERRNMLERVAAFARDPFVFAGAYAAETALLQEQIRSARLRLPKVKITSEDRRRLSLAALDLGVEGHRADTFSLRLARAHAALMGRIVVDESDIAAAEEFVLLPRSAANSQAGAEHRAPQHERDRSPDEAMPHDDAMSQGQGSPEPPIEDRIIPPLDASVPGEMLDLPPEAVAGSGTSDTGRRRKAGRETTNWKRGRYVRSVGERRGAGKIALAATLRAAAPFQIRRRSSLDPNGEELLASPAIRVEKGDLRFKQFKQKAGILIVFAVDASGSMALNRIHQAKGALLRLLGQSYLHRDQVALVSFRGKTAEVLLEPSQSVELAKRALDALPVGGGTPLSAGLRTVFHLVRRARQKGGRPTLLVLFTDGHANVAFDSGDSANGRAAIWPQIEKTCAALRREGIVSLVVDTSRRDAGGEEATRLAQLLDGRHFCLRNPEAGVHDEVAQALERLRI